MPGFNIPAALRHLQNPGPYQPTQSVLLSQPEYVPVQPRPLPVANAAISTGWWNTATANFPSLQSVYPGDRRPF